MLSTQIRVVNLVNIVDSYCYANIDVLLPFNLLASVSGKLQPEVNDFHESFTTLIVIKRGLESSRVDLTNRITHLKRHCEVVA